jgi:heptosyltransferase-3
MVLLVTPHIKGTTFDVRTERIEKILLVRANFRMGNVVLAAPAIFEFRCNFPHARIDFVGSPVSETLFRNLPIDHHYRITRRFPNASWAYLFLVNRLRRIRYDLAVELSGGASSMGSFIVGFSGARFRVGSQGKRDSWFNVRIPKTMEKNKYRTLPAFTTAMGLIPAQVRRTIILTEAETAEGNRRIDSLTARGSGPVVGIFIGGRNRRGKRWPIHHFLELMNSLYSRSVKVVVFAGPEERSLLPSLAGRMHPQIALVLEPSVRLFAAMVTHCQLFVTSDTGPMHLACALGVRTVAIFQKRNFQRWGPPASIARIVYRPGGVSVEEVVDICAAELSERSVSASPSTTAALHG